jgi:hypothetical protein
MMVVGDDQVRSPSDRTFEDLVIVGVGSYWTLVRGLSMPVPATSAMRRMIF